MCTVGGWSRLSANRHNGDGAIPRRFVSSPLKGIGSNRMRMDFRSSCDDYIPHNDSLSPHTMQMLKHPFPPQSIADPVLPLVPTPEPCSSWPGRIAGRTYISQLSDPAADAQYCTGLVLLVEILSTAAVMFICLLSHTKVCSASQLPSPHQRRMGATS